MPAPKRGPEQKGKKRGAPQKHQRPTASTPAVRQRMQNTLRKDTPGELRLRKELSAKGLRYRIEVPLPGTRRRADIALIGLKLAIFVDGCFWHGCPVHGTWPKTNSEWWRLKIEANQRRDKDTNMKLRRAGWTVLRFWDHMDTALAAKRVVMTLERLKA